MAKYKAFYASEEEIPQFARDNNLYTQKNGRWEFDHQEFSEIDTLVSPGLASNKNDILNEKRAVEASLSAEKTRADNAEAELRKVQKHGSKLITPEDATIFESYKSLGAPKDLEKIKKEHSEFAQKITSFETESSLKQICDKGNLNFEVVRDFMSSDKGKGLKLVTKEVKEKDSKGKEATVTRVFASVEEDKGNGRFESKEYLLSDYAKDNLPKYMASALFQEEAPDNKAKASVTTRVPALSMSQSNSDDKDEPKSIADKFNNQRNSRQLPWVAEKTNT